MKKTTQSAEILQPPQPGQGSATDQAEAWLVYLYSGSATEQGRLEFARWLHESAAHASAYANVEQLWRDLRLIAETAERPKPTEAESRDATVVTPFVRRNMQAAQAVEADTRRHRLRASLAAAAVVIVAVAVGWLQLYGLPGGHYATDIGEIKTVSLADGTQVTLSGDSAIVASIDELHRSVELTRGRAYFDVVPDKQRVFRVRAAGTEIRVVGTAFDVNKGPDGVRVSVTEGKVEIAEIQESPGPRAPSPGSSEPRTPNPEPRVLEPGQQLLASLDGALLGEPQVFDPSEALSWKKGRLHYVNTPWATVVDEVNRYRETKIVLADQTLADFHVTTSFRTDQTEQLLSGLAKSYPVQIARSPDNVTVYAR